VLPDGAPRWSAGTANAPGMERRTAHRRTRCRAAPARPAAEGTPRATPTPTTTADHYARPQHRPNPIQDNGFDHCPKPTSADHPDALTVIDLLLQVEGARQTPVAHVQHGKTGTASHHPHRARHVSLANAFDAETRMTDRACGRYEFCRHGPVERPGIGHPSRVLPDLSAGPWRRSVRFSANTAGLTPGGRGRRAARARPSRAPRRPHRTGKRDRTRRSRARPAGANRHEHIAAAFHPPAPRAGCPALPLCRTGGRGRSELATAPAPESPARDEIRRLARGVGIRPARQRRPGCIVASRHRPRRPIRG
jgi:hypothetical protein